MQIDIPNPPPEGCISCEVRGHVLLIGINRPAKRNGWTPAMFQQLAEAYTRLDDEPELRVGLLHAFGEHFTAGLDLPVIAEFMKSGQKVIPAGLVEPHDYGLPGYRRRTKPMVAAVKGICFTVGIELMLGADIVVAADSSRFAQMEVQRCIMPTGGATLRMHQSAGWGNAMRWLLTGDEFDAHEALRLGLVQEVMASEDLLPRAIELANRIARQAPLGVQATLMSARLARMEGEAVAAAALPPMVDKLLNSEDAKEGVRAMVEKRPGVFKGI